MKYGDYIKINDDWYMVIDDRTAEKCTPLVALSCELNYAIQTIKQAIAPSLLRVADFLDKVIRSAS